MLKTLPNDKKTPCIPPIFHNNKYIVDFKEKSKIFSTFFAEQCSIIPDKSVLPSQLTLLTENSLANCSFSNKDILQIIRNLDSNKAHDYDMISIRMLKLCGNSICKPLDLIFKTFLRNGRFLLKWKKANVAPNYKKGDKLSKTIFQFYFYLFVRKYLHACFMIPCLTFLLRIIYFLQINLDSDREILVSLNFFQLIIKF